MTDSLLVDIVKSLEDAGMSKDSYTLQEWIDPEAVEQVLESS